MSDLTPEVLIRIAEHYYPKGFPPEEDDPRLPEQAFERTPEYARWLGLWGQAPAVERWRALKSRWRAEFPHLEFLDLTRPRGAACYLGLVYFREPRPDGSTRVTRLVGTVSLLAPLYLVYVTTQTAWPGRRFSPPELLFSLPERVTAELGGDYPHPGPLPVGEGTSTVSTHSLAAVRPYADRLALLFEQVWGARPFPLALADVPLGHLRIFHLNQEQPRLLNAFFLEQLDNLP
jgi:hypothetical protein